MPNYIQDDMDWQAEAILGGEVKGRNYFARVPRYRSANS
jgi:hypothetical protein